MAKNRRRGRQQARAQRRGTGLKPKAAADVAQNFRQAIMRHAAQMTRRMNQNRAGFSAEEILAAFGADAEAFKAYLAAATALGLQPTQ
jgi:hypothetical protein